MPATNVQRFTLYTRRFSTDGRPIFLDSLLLDLKFRHQKLDSPDLHILLPDDIVTPRKSLVMTRTAFGQPIDNTYGVPTIVWTR